MLMPASGREELQLTVGRYRLRVESQLVEKNQSYLEIVQAFG